MQESLAYVAPAALVVGWIYWAGRRERRRSARLPARSTIRLAPLEEDLEDDDILGPPALAPPSGTVARSR